MLWRSEAGAYVSSRLEAGGLTPAAGQSRIYRTNRPDAKAVLCFGAPIHPSVGQCKPDITISVNNPESGTPSLAIGRVLDQKFGEDVSKSVTTMVGRSARSSP